MPLTIIEELFCRLQLKFVGKTKRKSLGKCGIFSLVVMETRSTKPYENNFHWYL